VEIAPEIPGCHRFTIPGKGGQNTEAVHVPVQARVHVPVHASGHLRGVWDKLVRHFGRLFSFVCEPACGHGQPQISIRRASLTGPVWHLAIFWLVTETGILESGVCCCLAGCRSIQV